MGESRRIERFFEQVARKGPRRRRIQAGGLLLGVVGGAGAWLEWNVLAGLTVCALSMGVAGMWTRWCGEVLRTGALRWAHRDRGVIEIELLGGGRGLAAGFATGRGRDIGHGRRGLAVVRGDDGHFGVSGAVAEGVGFRHPRVQPVDAGRVSDGVRRAVGSVDAGSEGQEGRGLHGFARARA